MPNSAMKKHSISVDGKKSSLSLEMPFWRELQRMAKAAGVTATEMIARIDAARTHNNLSSAVRLAVLADLKAAVALHSGQPAHPQAAE